MHFGLTILTYTCVNFLHKGALAESDIVREKMRGKQTRTRLGTRRRYVMTSPGNTGIAWTCKQVLPKSLNEPNATHSVFGWALHGHLGNSTLSEIMSNFIQLEHKLDRIWQIENDYFDSKSHSVDDSKVIELWDRKIKHIYGHYVFPIPWRKGHADLPKFIAQCRLDRASPGAPFTNMV